MRRAPLRTAGPRRCAREPTILHPSAERARRGRAASGPASRVRRMDEDPVDLAALREEYAAGGLDVGRPGRRPDRDVPALARRGARRRAARAQRDGGRHGRRRRAARRRGWCCSRALDERGFVFYTNHDLPQGPTSWPANPQCALLFPWHPLERQVRVEGTAEPCSRARRSRPTSRTRPRGSQLGAWASPAVAAWSRRATSSTRRTPTWRRGSPAQDVPLPDRLGRLPGRARDAWSSGRAGRAGCTTGWSTPRARRRAAGGSERLAPLTIDL